MKYLYRLTCRKRVTFWRMAMKTVFVNKDDCTSCSLCADTLPNYFRLDSNDLAESHNQGENVNSAQIPEEDHKKVQESIDDCPGECIHWKA